MAIGIRPPLTEEDARGLRAGDKVFIDGVIYTARDTAHQRLVELLGQDGRLPFALEGQVIYYCGPTPAAPGRATGSAGPTTSSRMDSFTPLLLAEGIRAVIGKGQRGEEVAAALRQHGAVYLAAVGGAGALLAERITSAEAIAWPELGTEAVFRLEVQDFPAIVAMDSHGGDIFRDGRERFLK